jgi:hypothetical protein
MPLRDSRGEVLPQQPARRPLSQQPRVGSHDAASDRALVARVAGGFTAGRSIAALARSYRIPRGTIRDLLAKAGVRSVRALIGLDENEMAPELANRARQGATVDELSIETGLDGHQIREFIRSVDGPPKRERRPGVLDARIDELVELYEGRMSIRDIAGRVDSAPGTVRRALINAGVQLRGPGRPARRDQGGASTSTPRSSPGERRGR